jgi:hypothetical protein
VSQSLNEYDILITITEEADLTPQVNMATAICISLTPRRLLLSEAAGCVEIVLVMLLAGCLAKHWMLLSEPLHLSMPTAECAWPSERRCCATLC